jgi:exonuclease III
MCAGVHPNAGPMPYPHYTFIQFKCNGIQNTRSELQEFLNNHQVKVAAIQETKLTAKYKKNNFQGYTLVRRDRPVGGGGRLAFLVHQMVRYVDLDVSTLVPQNDSTIEIEGISVFLNGSYIKVLNVYIPPASAPAGYVPDITKVLEIDDDALILGDLNAHATA